MNMKECSLGDLITFQRGHDLPKTSMIPGEYPVVGSNGIIGYHNEFTTEAPSISVGRSGNVGNPFIYYGRTWSHNTSLYIKEFRDCDPIFIYYLLKTLDLGNYAGGSAVPTLNRNHIHSLSVVVPEDIEVQKSIARLLRMLDEKIELNHQINDNLQRQAAALFANFYDQAETEVGFTEIIQILGGGTPKTSESSYWNGNVPFFTPKDVGLPYTLTTEKTITEEGLAHCNSRLYPINTVFVTARGTVGKVGLPGVPMAMNQSCYALVGKDTHQILVYFYTLKAVDRLKHKASGAVFDAITTRDFEAENIMKLSDDDEKAFLDVAEPIYHAVLSNSIENLRLATLRDSLLPKLMSGEIDVSAIQL